MKDIREIEKLVIGLSKSVTNNHFEPKLNIIDNYMKKTALLETSNSKSIDNLANKIDKMTDALNELNKTLNIHDKTNV